MIGRNTVSLASLKMRKLDPREHHHVHASSRPRFQTIRYRIKTKAVEAVGSLVTLMGKLNLAPSTSVLDVLERALLLVGKARADLCDARCARNEGGRRRVST